MLGVAAVIEQNLVSDTEVIPKEIARLSSWTVKKYEIKDGDMNRTARAEDGRGRGRQGQRALTS